MSRIFISYKQVDKIFKIKEQIEVALGVKTGENYNWNRRYRVPTR